MSHIFTSIKKGGNILKPLILVITELKKKKK